jgi:thiol-disulfide isomerase/thioredoxin
MTRGVRERKLRSFGWALPAVVLVLVLSVFLLYIGRGTHTGGNHPVDGNQPLQIGKPPPAIRAVAFNGAPVDLAGLRGKVVLVNFFASWCAECRAEIPDIEQSYRAKRAAGFEVIAVNAWENGDGRSFLAGLGGTFPAVADPLPAPNRPGAIAASYGLDTPALPVSVFIDRGGNVHAVYPGRIDAGNIAAELHRMGVG